MSGYKHAAFLFVLCLAGYGVTLGQKAYLHDDAWLVGDNAMIAAGAPGLGPLLGSDLWAAADGARMQRAKRPLLYRPLLQLTFFVQRAVTGRDARPLHAVNLLLHAAACWLAFLAFRRRLSEPAALAGAALFAVMPTHVEAVAAVTGRSEVLSAVLLLGAWLLLDGRPARARLAGATLLFTAALFVKEHSLLFPIALAAADWTFEGRTPWSRERRGAYAALFASIALYLVVRLGVARVAFSGGVPYFGDRLTAALTMSRFVLTRYLWPSLTGLGLCTDFAPPLIPYLRPGAPGSWPAFLALAALYAGAARALLLRRERWAFLLCASSLFLLPTTHVLASLNEIGAQRFLYLPSLGLAAGLGALWARARAARPRLALAAGAAVLALHAWSCAAYAATWSDGIPYYERALACNPVSARAHAAYGMKLAAAGRVAEGEAQLRDSVRLDANLPLPRYNLARLAWDRGDAREAEKRVAETLELDPAGADAWVLAAMVDEKFGRPAAAQARLRRALALAPWNAIAHFNLARLELAEGRAAESIPHWRAFVTYAPDDPDAARAKAIADELEARASAAR